MIYRVGLDIGSTTVKIAVLDEEDRLVYSEYKRHFANIKETIAGIIGRAYDACLKGQKVRINVTGSGGLSVSKWLSIPFVQEVIASTTTVEKLAPLTDVAIELGGEDAKITYFGTSIEQRMNGTCAGGTGAFIDQMAGLLQTDAGGLNKLAEKATTIYPIAARCGVFAKTDVQPMINEGAPKEDIAASIFQAVVNQTIAGLAQGKPIRGHVAFLGGPLYFLPQLRRRFIETLKLTPDEVIVPENPQLFVAIGAAYASEKSPVLDFDAIYQATRDMNGVISREIQRLEPLFKDEADYRAFCERHGKDQVERADLSKAQGPVYLGIDAGSTTTKAVLMDENYRLLYTFYGSNEGSPIDKTKEILEDVYSKIPEKAYIAAAVSTGYGEKLVQTAFHADLGEIETMAHYKAAEHFLPGVEFILDIGGQDMKCIRVKDGVIHDILLNEACSSGCGSFLENFAHSLNMPIRDFAKAAVSAKEPVDLGSRCTVFMNSRVKQAQKEGASVGDISAGLSYSVIRNALQKVIKIRDYSKMGQKIIVQGGTFYNDAVLMAFEKITGRQIVRPDIAGIMGAYGCAIIGKERIGSQGRSKIMKAEELKEFSYHTTQRRCGKCANNCLLTINDFSSGDHLISGNRCERGAGLEISNTEKNLNIYNYKEKRVFDYKPLKKEEAPMGQVGIPRALNMYENYPFWFTFFTKLGFQVILSPRTSKRTFVDGMETIPSESVCYPAKLTHGHVMWLINHDIKFIFYPCVPLERQLDEKSDNHYNCPIVTSYPETIKNNIEAIQEKNVTFMNPFLNLANADSVKKELYKALSPKYPSLSKGKVDDAVDAAYQELAQYHSDVVDKGAQILKEMREKKMHGIVLAGRPYHVDPEINHGLDKIITELDMAVLTEDSVAEKADLQRPLRVLDQWSYHSRLYDAAEYVGHQKDLELVQLFSFGCGVDAVTTDQVSEILESHNKSYTMIKIDEGSNLGAIRIRLRSLKASIEEKERKNGGLFVCPDETPYTFKKVMFTKEMKEAGYTILAPQMSPIHFTLMQHAFKKSGYHVEVLPSIDHEAINYGLRYVNNDACYPSILVAGQMMSAIKSGKYDPHKIVLAITQTGGGCRASNYVGFIRKMLNDSGYGYIPVMAISAGGIEKHPGWNEDIGMANRALMAFVYGDVLMRLLYRQRPYEQEPGSANALYEKWNKICCDNVEDGNLATYHKNIKNMIREFAELPIKDIKKPRVGIVGEILIKFHPTGNNQLVDVLESEGAEAVVPDLLDFFLYSAYNANFKTEHYGFSKKSSVINNLGIRLIEQYRSYAKKELGKYPRFGQPNTIQEKAKLVDGIMSLGNQTGEGWLLTSEMIELMEEGVNNIVAVQPFACLPNHIVAKSMFKTVRNHYPMANIAAVDYDPGASEVNQLNRIKLMLAVAFKNLEKDEQKSGAANGTDD